MIEVEIVQEKCYVENIPFKCSEECFFMKIIGECWGIEKCKLDFAEDQISFISPGKKCPGPGKYKLILERND